MYPSIVWILHQSQHDFLCLLHLSGSSNRGPKEPFVPHEPVRQEPTDRWRSVYFVFVGTFTTTVLKERTVSDVKDSDIPEMIQFNMVVSSFCVVFGALFIVSSILMLVGVTTSRKYLLIPWLVVTYITLFGR